MAIHDHQREGPRGQRELFVAMLLTGTMMLVEFVAGYLTGSLALMADAGHMLTDASALALSGFAAWVAARPASPEKTYGYYRTEILAALANGVTLWVMVIWIFGNALVRLQSPQPVLTGPMLVVAALGLVVNLVIGRMLTSARRGSLNVQAAWLNVMSDALGSVGVIVAGLCIRAFGWTVADPIASLLIGALIAMSAWSLVRQSVNVLLEGAPGHIKIDEVIAAMRAVPGVADVHDLHCWTITTGMDAVSGHVIVEDLRHSAEMLDRLNALLKERFGITHTTLQLEPRGQQEPVQYG